MSEALVKYSKCLKEGQEIYERFNAGGMFTKSVMWYYFYRHISGELFFCVAPSLEECRKLKEEWIQELEN